MQHISTTGQREFPQRMPMSFSIDRIEHANVMFHCEERITCMMHLQSIEHDKRAHCANVKRAHVLRVESEIPIVTRNARLLHLSGCHHRREGLLEVFEPALALRPLARAPVLEVLASSFSSFSFLARRGTS